jgi:arginine/lysine/histidine/glutamine transport system substrate-binding and permease protein
MPEAFTIILQALPNLLQGMVITLELTILAALISLGLGILLGVARMSKPWPLRWLARGYIDFLRGTPLLVQIFMIYFGLPAIAQQLGLTFNLDRLAAGVLALGLNGSAYIAEIVRAGIQSIEIGQWEAAASLGLKPMTTMVQVIFPQAIRRMIPPLGNEFITLMKDTSLVAVIGFEELFRRGQLIVAQNYRAFEVYTAVALLYLILTISASQGLSKLENWMNRSQPRR